MPVGGEKEYYLASACAELYAPPSAYVALYGLTIQQTFLRGNCMYGDDMIPLCFFYNMIWLLVKCALKEKYYFYADPQTCLKNFTC